MDVMARVLETVLPLMVALGLGMICRRTKLFTSEGVSVLKSLVVNVTLPAVMFAALAKAEYTPASLLTPVVIFAACGAALGLGYAACKLLHIKGRLTPYLATGFEAGMLGYALYALLFPGQSTSKFAIVDLGQVLFVFTVYKALLAGKGGLKGAVGEALRSPVVWAIGAGIVVGASGLYRLLEGLQVSTLIDGVTDFIAAPTGAVILLAIGYELVPSEIRWRATAALIGMRLAIMAVLFCAISLVNTTLLHGAIDTGALALLCILPPPFVLPVFADMGDERANIVSALSALTLVTILLFAALTLIFA